MNLLRMGFSSGVLFALALMVLGGTVHAGICVDDSLPEYNPDNAYVVHGDGTVTDIRTGLMWKQCAEGQSWDGAACVGTASSYTWDNALILGEANIHAGHVDWRLPSINELRSLIETCRINPAINTIIFPNTPASKFWAGSPWVGNSSFTWGVDFNWGDTSDYLSNDSYRNGALLVRLVRAGQSLASFEGEADAVPAASATFLAENLPDGSFHLGPGTKRWRFRSGGVALNGLKAVRVSADADLGITATQVNLGTIAANTEFVVEVPVNPVRTPGSTTPKPKSVWKLVDGQNNDVPITNSANNTFWVMLRINRPPRFLPTQLGAIGGVEGTALSLPLLAEDPDGDAVSFSVVSGGGSIIDGVWSGTAALSGGEESQVQKLVLRVSDGMEWADYSVDRVVYGSNGLQHFFADVPRGAMGNTNSVYAATHYLATKGIVLGCGNNGGGQRIFCPDDAVSQAEALKMLLRSAEARDALALLPAPRVPLHFMRQGRNHAWAAPYAYTAEHLGLIESVELFDPAAPVSRVELARWLVALLKLELPLPLLETYGQTELYQFSDEAAFANAADLEAALQTAFFGYLGTLGSAFSPNAELSRGEFAVVAGKVLRAAEITGLSYAGTTLEQRFGRTLPTITHGQTLQITGVEGLRAREIRISGDRVIEEWIDPAAGYVRVGVLLFGHGAVGTMRYVNAMAGNPMVLDTNDLDITADTQISLMVFVDTPVNTAGQDLPRSGTRSLYSFPLAIDFPDQDGDGVRDDLDLWPDDARFTVDVDGNGYPDEVDGQLLGQGVNAGDPVIIAGVNQGYTYGQAMMDRLPPYALDMTPTHPPRVTVTGAGQGSVSASVSGTPISASGGQNTWTHVTQYPDGTALTLTAVADAGSQFAGWGGVCVGNAPACSLTLHADHLVTALFVPAGTPPGAGNMPGTGGSTVIGTVPEGSVGGGGQISATVEDEGGADWVFTEAATIAPANSFGNFQGEVTFPFGTTRFKLELGEPGSTALLRLTYPEALPPGARYFRFGATANNATPHWHVFEEAGIWGNTVTLPLLDGGAGDDDALANSIILHQGGPGVAQLPTLNLSLHDGVEQVRGGQVIDYRITLRNPNAFEVQDVTVSLSMSADLDAGAAQTACEASGGATCPLPGVWTIPALPANGSLVWVVSVPVFFHATQSHVSFAVAATGANEVEDRNIIMLFENGFEAILADPSVGLMDAIPLVSGGRKAASGRGVAVRVPALDWQKGVSVLASWRGEAGKLSLERIQLGNAMQARLKLREDGGTERIGQWLRADPASVLDVQRTRQRGGAHGVVLRAGEGKAALDVSMQ